MRHAIALVSCAALFAAAPAQAGSVLVGAHVGGGIPLATESTPTGLGLGGRLGYVFDFKLARAIPEAEFTWFAGNDGLALPEVGGHVYVLRFVEPGIFAHYALPFGGGFPSGAMGFDAGLSLDLTFIPMVDVGADGGMMFLAPTDPAVPTADSELFGTIHVAFKIPTGKD